MSLSRTDDDVADTVHEVQDADCYQRLRTGALNVATGAGQWQFELALIKASAGL